MNKRTYQEELQDLYHRRVYYITLVGAVMILLFGVLDRVAVPQYFHEFLGYRIAVALLSIVLLAGNFFDKKKLYAEQIGLIEYLLVSFILLFMIYRTGRGDSPFYVGLIVIMTIYSTLAPLSVFQSLFSGLFIVFCYTVTIYLSRLSVHSFSMEVFSNLFFIICFVLIIATQSWTETKARKKQFRLRQQELDVNGELSRRIASLEEEVGKRSFLQAATEERYHLLFDQIPDDVVVLSPEANIVQHNQSFTNNYLANCTVKVTSFFQIVASDDQKTIKNLINNTMASGKPVRSCSLKLIRSDGSSCETEINISHLTRNRISLGVLLVIRDIGTRKELGKRLFTSLKLKKETENAAIMSLAKLSEYRDVTPKNHLERIREYCRILALQLSRQPEYVKTISSDFIQDIYHASILHDIGKVSIPDALWKKSCSLTQYEEEKIHNHTLIGGNVIAQMEGENHGPSFLSMAKDIAYFHHERWDGTGYPLGMKKEEIPLAARIMALVRFL